MYAHSDSDGSIETVHVGCEIHLRDPVHMHRTRAAAERCERYRRQRAERRQADAAARMHHDSDVET